MDSGMCEFSWISLSCLLCEQTFGSAEKLQDHLIVHFPQPVDRSHICDICGRGMRSPLELHQHYNRYHEAHVTNTDEGQFQCQLCDKVFLLQDYLNVHVKIEHSSEGYRPAEMYSACAKPYQSHEDLTNDDEDNSVLCPPPKRKYPPRSPFFNPDLGLDGVGTFW
nr:uncharacterized zinc finger protein CG12744 isoform X2 [Drosophila kikkawai]